MGRRWLTLSLSLLVILALVAGAQYIVNVDVDFRNHFSKDDPNLVALDPTSTVAAGFGAGLFGQVIDFA